MPRFQISFSVFLIDVSYLLCCGADLPPVSPFPPEISPNRFYYFAYGSNLLKKRVQMNNPTAKFLTIAKLEDFRLDFNVTLETWNGAVATIARDPGSAVWGAVWVIHRRDLVNLDKQEGNGWMYYDLDVPVVTPEQKLIIARTYIQYVDPPKLAPGQKLPPERQPSLTYLKVMLLGATECGLPSSYINKLKSITNNGKLASNQMRAILGYPLLD